MTAATTGVAARESPAEVRRYRVLAGAVISLCILLGLMDASIVNVAIPKMMSTFGSTLDDIQWVSTGYMLSMSVMIALTGYLGDEFGRKRLFTVSMAIFTVSSLLCALAWDSGSLIAFRVIQGIGGGALLPVGMALFTGIFPPELQGAAMGLIGMAATLGPVAGPSIGGYLVENVDWRAIFLVNVPLGILAVFGCVVVLRETERRHSSFDFWGFSTVSVFLIALLIALSRGNTDGWNSPYILGLFFIAAMAFLAFLAVEISVEKPLIDLSLFGSIPFSAANLVGIANGLLMYGAVFFLPIYAEELMHFTPIQTGLLLVPGGAAITLVMPIGGKLADKLPARWLIAMGMVIMISGLYLQTGITQETAYGTIMGWQLLRGVGQGIAFPSLNKVIFSTVPPQKIGQATGIYNLTRQIGGTFSISALTALITQRQVYHFAILVEALNRNRVFPAVRGLGGYLAIHGSTPARALEQARIAMGAVIGAQATTYAFQDAFLTGSMAALLLTLPVFLIITRPRPPVAGPRPIIVE